MAAQAFKIYNNAKRRLGYGATAPLDLRAGNFRVGLYTSASNAATLTLSTLASLTSEVTEANGYSSSGKALASREWTVGASAKSFKFDGADSVWTATGGTIPNIKFAVVWASGASAGARWLLAVASLTSTQFTLSANNTLTVQYNSLGIFTMQ